jgi:hypothetical protein
MPIQICLPQSLGIEVGGFHTFSFANGKLVVDRKTRMPHIVFRDPKEELDYAKNVGQTFWTETGNENPIRYSDCETN